MVLITEVVAIGVGDGGDSKEGTNDERENPSSAQPLREEECDIIAPANDPTPTTNTATPIQKNLFILVQLIRQKIIQKDLRVFFLFVFLMLLGFR